MVMCGQATPGEVWHGMSWQGEVWLGEVITMCFHGLEVVEYALRLSDGVTVLTNSGVIDNTPGYKGKVDTQCYFCMIGWKHSKLAHIHRLEESLIRLKDIIKRNS